MKALLSDDARERWFAAARNGDGGYLEQNLASMCRAKNAQGMTALMHAAAAGHTSCINLLLDEAREASVEGFTALGYAIRGAFCDSVIALLPHEGMLPSAPGLSPLALSLKCKHDAIARLCIEYLDPRMDLIHGSSDEFRTILILALELNDYGLLRDIIRRCHKLSVDDISEVISLETGKGPTFCITYLIGILDAFTHNFATRRSSPSSPAPLLSFQRGSSESGPSVEVLRTPVKVDDNGNTLLMRAVLAFNYKKMLEHAPVLNGAINKEGKTALMLAAEVGNESAAAVLKKYEAKFQDPSGTSALMFAVNKGNLKLVQMLAKCESGLKDVAGRTALMHAVLLNKQTIIVELIKYETCNQDFQGKTALMYAVEQNAYQACRALLPHEAGLADYRGLRAIDYAKLFDNTEMLDILEDKEGISREALQQILRRHGRVAFRSQGSSHRGSPRSFTLPPSSVNAPTDGDAHRDRRSSLQNLQKDTREDTASEASPPQISDLIAAVNSSRYYDIGVLAPHLANLCDYNGLTALHHAIYQNKRTAVRLLLPYEYGSLAGFAIPSATRPEITEMLNLYRQQGKSG